MIKPDIIISWPRNADYPLWRKFVRENRDRFNEIIVVFTETNIGHDYRQFVRDAMFQDHILFVQSPQVVGDEDWRNVAVNAGLLHSLHSEYIWFTEQDFTPLAGFWEYIDGNPLDVHGVYDGTRLHPCSILIRRKVLEKTKRQFGANPPAFDHFGQLQKDLTELIHNSETIIAVQPSGTYKHMAGLSHNMRLVTDGELPNHKVDDFNYYLAQCLLQTTVPLDPRFESMIHVYFDKIGKPAVDIV